MTGFVLHSSVKVCLLYQHAINYKNLNLQQTLSGEF